MFCSLVFDPELTLGQVTSTNWIAEVVAQEVGKTCDRIFSPLVTLALFLGQVLSDDHSCRAVVARLLAWRAARGLPKCSPDNGGYQVAAAERWGIRVSYDVDAPNAEEAVRMVKDQEVEVGTYSVNWEDHMEVDEILSVESETERFAVDPFNRPAAQPAPETEPTPVRTLQKPRMLPWKFRCTAEHNRDHIR